MQIVGADHIMRGTLLLLFLIVFAVLCILALLLVIRTLLRHLKEPQEDYAEEEVEDLPPVGAARPDEDLFAEALHIADGLLPMDFSQTSLESSGTGTALAGEKAAPAAEDATIAAEDAAPVAILPTQDGASDAAPVAENAAPAAALPREDEAPDDTTAVETAGAIKSNPSEISIPPLPYQMLSPFPRRDLLTDDGERRSRPSLAEPKTPEIHPFAGWLEEELQKKAEETAEDDESKKEGAPAEPQEQEKAAAEPTGSSYLAAAPPMEKTLQASTRVKPPVPSPVKTPVTIPKKTPTKRIVTFEIPETPQGPGRPIPLVRGAFWAFSAGWYAAILLWEYARMNGFAATVAGIVSMLIVGTILESLADMDTWFDWKAGLRYGLTVGPLAAIWLLDFSTLNQTVGIATSIFTTFITGGIARKLMTSSVREFES
jgi:hypothetical protein